MTICTIFGHRKTDWLNPPYLRMELAAVDRKGAVHMRLLSRCARCGERLHVANAVLPNDMGWPLKIKHKS